MNINDLKDYNLNYFTAIIGVLFLFRSLYISLKISSYYENFTIRFVISIVAAIIAISGILLFNNDYKISIYQYIIASISVVLADMTGFYPFVLFVLSAILVYIEKNKSKLDNYVESDAHYFDNSSVKIKEPKRKLILIPIISIIILVLLLVSSVVLYDMQMDAKLNAINITDLSGSTSVEYDYPKANITGKLVSSQTLDDISVKVYWYNDKGAQIDESYDSNIKSQIKEGQQYQLNLNYYGGQQAEVPTSAQIVVEDYIKHQILYSKNVTF